MSTIFKYLDTKEIKSIKVTDLILLALEKNQIFIGYVFQDKLHINPPKSEEISIDESLELVYIGWCLKLFNTLIRKIILSPAFTGAI